MKKAVFVFIVSLFGVGAGYSTAQPNQNNFIENRIPEGRGWWCFRTPDNGADCQRTLQMCNHVLNITGNRYDFPLTRCYQTDRAHCITFQSPLIDFDNQKYSCLPTRRMCREVRDGMRATTQSYSNVSNCRMIR